MTPPGPKPTGQLVMEWLAAHAGEPIPSGTEIARQIGRPKSYSYVAKLIRNVTTTGQMPTPVQRDYHANRPRGETRRLVQEYLDAHPGVELSNVEMARTLGLKEKTVGQAMRAIITERDAAAAPKTTRKASPPTTRVPAPGSLRVRGPVTGAEIAALRQPAPPANGLMAVIQATFGQVTVPSDVLVRVPGTNTRHGDGVVRDADGRLYELREM